MPHIGDLSENMKVRTRDGEELGTIIRLEAESILVEKGILSLEDYLVPIALVSEVRDGAAYLSATREELRRAPQEGSTGAIVARRTLRQESAEFAHEGEDLAGTPSRATDNMREGDVIPDGARR